MDILLEKRKSINSTNRESFVPVELDSTFKNQPDLDIVKYFDAYQCFLEERASANRYRVVLTINPYCTNVLCNPFTEIVKYENGRYSRADDNQGTLTFDPSDVYGKYSGVSRSDMVDDTEYSKTSVGYRYFPGYDIFGNHGIRNNSFKIVNPTKDNSSDRIRFNRVDDYMRDCFGDRVRFQKRKIGGLPEDVDRWKHLYNSNDIDSFGNGDVFKSKLYEENGWYGFDNRSSIDSKERIIMENSARKLDRDSLDINNVINYRGNGAFVDMCPQRELFSFSPSRNELTNEVENQWNTFLTYCSGKFYRHPIVYDEESGYNGLLVASVRYCTGVNGMKITLFRTYTKHGLKYMDQYSVWADGNEIMETFPVNGVGDVGKDFEDYYFYTNGDSVVLSLFSGRILDVFYEQGVQEFVFESENPIDQTTPMIPGANYVKYQNRFFVWMADSGASPFYHDMVENNVNFRLSTSRPQKTPSNLDEVLFLYVYDGLSYTPAEYVEMESIPENITDSSPRYIKVGNLFFERKIRIYFVNNNPGNNVQAAASVEELINRKLSNEEFVVRINRNIDGQRSEYYFRKMRKIPNLKFSSKRLTPEIASDDEEMKAFIDENARAADDVMYDFANENYDVAFANTIYGDHVSQKTYTDDIDLEFIMDNQGKLLSDIYVTVIKRNEGRREWYFDFKEDENYESSHCFGDLTSGIDIPIRNTDGSSFIGNAKKYSSIYGISDYERYSTSPLCQTLEDFYNPSVAERKNSISWRDDEFIGDLVEYNAMEYAERNISDVFYRFNTMQRDGSPDDIVRINTMFQYRGTDIVYDDYCGNKDYETTQSENVDPKRQEGYFYKAHYKIPVKELGPIKQGGCDSIWCTDAEDIVDSDGGRHVMVKSRFPHNLSTHDTLFLCDDTDESSEWIRCFVSSVDGRMAFYMDNPLNEDISERLKARDMVLRIFNEEIPSYAKRIGKDRFVWRDNLNVGDKNCKFLPEYPFANGCIYVDKTINFYLRRQDPYGYVGLLAANEFPADIEGVSVKTDTQIFKDENYYTC